MRSTPVCPPDHKHGKTATCYHNHACSCTPCRTEAVARRLAIRKQKAFGRWNDNRTDAGPARAHLHNLIEAGLTCGNVGKLTGLHTTTITNLAYGALRNGKRTHLRRICAENATAILALEAGTQRLAPSALVPATGTIRRLQALAVIGWSQGAMAGRLGQRKQNISAILRQSTVTITVQKRIASLYEELWNVTPPRTTETERFSYTRATKNAAAHRWLPPMAWDNIDTDITPPIPDRDADYIDEILLEIAMTGEHVRLTTREREEAVTRLNTKRLNDAEIATLLHVASDTVLRIRGRLGLPAAVGSDKQPLAA